MKRWSAPNGPGQKYIEVYSTQVVVGSYWRDGHSDNAGVCSLDEFLEGRFQDLILRDHGSETLAEVKEAAQRLQSRAMDKSSPGHQES